MIISINIRRNPFLLFIPQIFRSHVSARHWRLFSHEEIDYLFIGFFNLPNISSIEVVAIIESRVRVLSIFITYRDDLKLGREKSKCNVIQAKFNGSAFWLSLRRDERDVVVSFYVFCDRNTVARWIGVKSVNAVASIVYNVDPSGWPDTVEKPLKFLAVDAGQTNRVNIFHLLCCLKMWKCENAKKRNGTSGVVNRKWKMENGNRVKSHEIFTRKSRSRLRCYTISNQIGLIVPCFFSFKPPFFRSRPIYRSIHTLSDPLGAWPSKLIPDTVKIKEHEFVFWTYIISIVGYWIAVVRRVIVVQWKRGMVWNRLK